MINFIYWLVTILVIYIVLINLSLLDLSIKEILLMIILTHLLSFIFIHAEYLSMSVAIFAMIFFIYTKSKNVFLSICLPVFSLLVTVVNDYILISTENYIFNITSTNIRQNLMLYLRHGTFLLILNIFISSIFKYCLLNKIKLSNINLKGRISVYLTIILILTLIIFYTNIVLTHMVGISSNIVRINAIMFFIYFILLIIIMYILIKSVVNEIEITNKKKN